MAIHVIPFLFITVITIITIAIDEQNVQVNETSRAADGSRVFLNLWVWKAIGIIWLLQTAEQIALLYRHCWNTDIPSKTTKNPYWNLWTILCYFSGFCTCQ